MSSIWIRAALAAALLWLAAPVIAADAPPSHATYEQAKKFVDQAVAHLKKVGPDKAFADFNDPKGKWIKGDLYIFVFDGKGVYRATGFRPERTGSNAWDMKDASGTLPVVQEIIKVANRDGAGTVDYLWKNPATGTIENKTSYVVKAGDFAVGAGFYHK